MYDLIVTERDFEAEDSLESKFRQWQNKEISNFDYLVAVVPCMMCVEYQLYDLSSHSR